MDWRKRVLAIVAIGVFLALVVATLPGVFAVERNNSDRARVSDTLGNNAGSPSDNSDLQPTDPDNPILLSGVVNNTFKAGYFTSSPAGGDMETEASIWYTLNGDPPWIGNGPGSTARELVIPDIQDPPQLAQAHYEGDLAGKDIVANVTGGSLQQGFGHLVKFVVRACEIDIGTNCITDPSTGFYQYAVETSRPQVIDFSIPATASLDGKRLTDERKPALSFTIKDNPLHTKLKHDLDASNYGGASVTINNSPNPTPRCTSTTDTNCFAVTQVTEFLEYGFVYRYPTTGGELPVGPNHIIVNTQDEAGNKPLPINFTIDVNPPVIGDISAIPEEGFQQADGTYLTSRGSEVNVTAEVEDPQEHMDTAPPSTKSCADATWPVCARFKDTIDPTTVSAYFPLHFDADEETWRNLTAVIPTSLPAEEMRLIVEVRAMDAGGATETKAQASPSLVVDPTEPQIAGDFTGNFIPVAPLELDWEITDSGSGLVTENVTIWFRLNSGSWIDGPPNVTQHSSGYFIDHPPNSAGSTFEYTIPAVAHESELEFFLTAPDRAGNNASTVTHVVDADGQGPVVAEEPRALFRGDDPHVFEVEITDTISGVNQTRVSVFYAVPGASFVEVGMAPSGTADVFTATVEGLDLDEGDRLRYYYVAFDEAGNRGELGTESNALTSIIDLTAPTFTLTAPSSATGPTFEVTWSASDPRISASQQGSGVGAYTIFARVSGTTTWVPILQNTTDTSTTVCAEAGRTYEFTGFATDTVGNSGDRSESPLGTTALTGESCAERLIVNVLAPNTAGASFNAQGGVGTMDVRWSATTTRILSPNDQHEIDILFSPDNGVNFYEVASDLANAGEHDLPMELPTCSQCFIKVRATSVEGVVGEDTGAVFQITNGDTEVDLDGNGLPDTWEMQYAGQLGVTNPNVDLDGDGLNNRREAQHGTDPANRDTDGDSFSDGLEVRVGTDPLDPQSVPTEEQARVEQWTAWYWSVPIMFGVCAILFFIGLARRW